MGEVMKQIFIIAMFFLSVQSAFANPCESKSKQKIATCQRILAETHVGPAHEKINSASVTLFISNDGKKDHLCIDAEFQNQLGSKGQFSFSNYEILVANDASEKRDLPYLSRDYIKSHVKKNRKNLNKSEPKEYDELLFDFKSKQMQIAMPHGKDAFFTVRLSCD